MLSTAWTMHGCYQADLGATALLIAAERHRIKTGHWPESATAIDPAILPVPPLAPFSGEPFHMEHRDGQLVIYSIGPNGKDEQSAFDLQRWQKGGPDDVGAAGWDVPRRGRPPVGDGRLVSRSSPGIKTVGDAHPTKNANIN